MTACAFLPAAGLTAYVPTFQGCPRRAVGSSQLPPSSKPRSAATLEPGKNASSVRSTTVDGNRLHHLPQLVQGRPVVGRPAHASLDDSPEWFWHGPLDLTRDGRVGVDHALDAAPDVVDVGSGRPSRVLHPTAEGDLRGGALAPAALEVADHQAAAVLGEEAVVDPEVPVHDAEGVEAREGVDDVEGPAPVRLEGGEARQDRPAGGQLLEDQLSIGGGAEETDKMRGEDGAGA